MDNVIDNEGIDINVTMFIICMSILCRLLTIIDEAGGVDNMGRMMYNLERMF